MHYVIGDIHNDLKKLNCILKQIHITAEDEREEDKGAVLCFLEPFLLANQS